MFTKIYDGNNNITYDPARKASVAYNYLNLPRQIQINGKTLAYTYDTGGQKRSFSNNGSLTTYEGSFEYDGADLPVRISTPEGQLVKVGSSWQWQYYLTDQLGNVRLVLDEGGNVVQETDYYPFGLAITKNPSDLSQSRAKNKYLYLNRELQAETGYLDLMARFYDPVTGRFVSVDPLTDQQEQLTPYHYGYNNPLRYSDPDGECPTCPVAAAGAVVGGLIGGGFEVASQYAKHGEIVSWQAVGGATARGAITGGIAGLTGGTSLLASASAGAVGNVIGGIADNAIQGKSINTQSVIKDAVIGAAAGTIGHGVGKIIQKGLDNLSSHAKGKIGEFATEVKYIAKGYTSEGKAVVPTGARTATGRPQVAKYDHEMKNIVTGRRLTVESKFNNAVLTKNQRAAINNIATQGGLIIDRTTSSQLGNASRAIVTGSVVQKK